ncbi:FUSC family protein [Martelella endophytica]|uniref:Membrane protein n=1 Tax=Martelella endophytica TaxID=1486262 RepID=A0A0D5LLM6_MAREN|nr:FUSC family protein [Martelella endophytica]AJY45099.1 membrane protein [Martelella endophytica]
MSGRSVVTTANVVFSLKTFLAAMLAYFIAIRFGLPRPFWAVATVYIVAHPISGAIVSKSVYRLIGTMIGGVATLVMVPNLVQAPILLSSAIIAWVSACTFVSLLDRTPRSYVPLLAGYTVLLAGLPLVTAPADTFETVVSRIEEIGLGIICASLVSQLILPVHVGTVLMGRIDGWVANAHRLLSETAAGAADKRQKRTERHGLAAEAADIRSFATHLQYDGSRYRPAVSLVRLLQHRMITLLPLLGELDDLRTALTRLNAPAAGKALSLIAEAGQLSPRSAEARDAEINALVRPDANRSWETLVLANVSRTLKDILRVSDECDALREAIDEENAARTAHRFSDFDGIPAYHRDLGMAFLSAFAVATCLATSISFWIASGWSDGMTFAQISGVLCCLLATMDNPIPAMRKFVDVTIGAVIAAFIYGFAVLPMIDGFVPLVAALGLFLIPAGLCLAVPSLAIVGMGLCINFPLLLALQAKQSADFLTFANTGVATILAMIWTIIVCGLTRSVRAETNARRLFAVTRKHVARIAAGRHADGHMTQHKVLDVTGLFASRAGSLPPSSEASNPDMIRVLRAGLHLTAMQDLLDDVSPALRIRANTLFNAAKSLYRRKPTKQSDALEAALTLLDDLILSAQGGHISEIEREFLVRAAALRLCLAPEGEPSASMPHPERRMVA